jgi:hypothetical protein
VGEVGTVGEVGMVGEQRSGRGGDGGSGDGGRDGGGGRGVQSGRTFEKLDMKEAVESRRPALGGAPRRCGGPVDMRRPPASCSAVDCAGRFFARLSWSIILHTSVRANGRPSASCSHGTHGGPRVHIRSFNTHGVVQHAWGTHEVVQHAWGMRGFEGRWSRVRLAVVYPLLAFALPYSGSGPLSSPKLTSPR